MPADRYDIAVVGAGIVGLAVAREVLTRRPDAKVLVIDKATAVAQHQTGHNFRRWSTAGVCYGLAAEGPALVHGAKFMYESASKCHCVRALRQADRRRQAGGTAAPRRSGGPRPCQRSPGAAPD